MPRPMTPTQLTVLTRASVSAAKMLPCLYVIMAAPLNQYQSGKTWAAGRCSASFVQRLTNSGTNCSRVYADPPDQGPRKTPMHEKFRLFAFLHGGRPEVGGGHCVPIDLAEFGDFASERRVDGTGIRQTERPSTSLLLYPFDNFVKVRFEVRDGFLAAAVR